jgi:hypothetical protein
MILYTDDGHMSAQLADADMGGYIAYGGRFDVDEDTSGRAKRRERCRGERSDGRGVGASEATGEVSGRAKRRETCGSCTTTSPSR